MKMAEAHCHDESVAGNIWDRKAVIKSDENAERPAWVGLYEPAEAGDGVKAGER